MEVGKYGITVNCVAPGPTQTGWINADLEKAVIPLIPMGKLIQPEDIANTILFLASEQAAAPQCQKVMVFSSSSSDTGSPKKTGSPLNCMPTHMDNAP